MNPIYHDILPELYECALVPVVTLNDRDTALRLAEAFLKGHMRSMEIAMRNDAAAECLLAVHAAFPEMALGAGTVLTPAQLHAARQAGARFAVSPGYDEDIVRESLNMNMPFIPGTVSPSDIIRGIKAGVPVIKFFPSEPYGGLTAIKFLAAPFQSVRFLPAGGVTRENYRAYLDCPAVFACAGGFMARDAQIKNGEWNEITAVCEEIRQAALKRAEKYPCPY